jgi:hypothetical protein
MMLNARRIGFWVICLAGLAAGGKAKAADFSGHLSDSHGAVRRATIEIVELHRSLTTSNNGSFTFTDLAAGHYTLRISIAGATKKSIDKAIVIGDGPDVVADIMLTAGSESGGGGALDAILVTAARLPLSIARAREYEAPNIVSVITAEEIRELPDVSAAEAVRRLPGVSAENDTGEARFINIRGLDADLNGTTFAGVRLLSFLAAGWRTGGGVRHDTGGTDRLGDGNQDQLARTGCRGIGRYDRAVTATPGTK